MSKLGVLFMHGMGHQLPEYADGMIGELKERVGNSGVDRPRSLLR